MINNINSIKDLCVFIWYLEDKYDLINFEIDEVKIWQYLRMEIYYELAEKIGVLEKRHESQKTTSILLMNAFSLLKNLFIANPFFSSKRNIDTLIFTHSRSKKINNKFEDIYTYYLSDELKGRKQNYLCFEKPFQANHIRSRDKHTQYLDFILSASVLYGKLYKIKQKKHLLFIQNIEKEIFEATNISIDLSSLFKHNIGRFKLANKLYLMLFKKLKPKVIYSVATYSYLGDMIAAAKSLRIKTIELQHGVVSKYHMGYSFSKKQKLLYYADEFYSWGKFWNSSVQNAFDQIHVKGFEYFRNNKTANDIVKKSKNVLILSQAALGQKIMQETLKYMDSFSGYQILYKLHPEEYQMYKSYSDYKTLSLHKNIQFIEECNLYEMMAKSEVQIGVFSTALYEGLGLSCNTFLYNLNGMEYMQDLIDSEYATVLSVGIDIRLKEFKYNSVNNFF